MDIKQAVLCALDREGILFAGAGFSFGAQNRLAKSLPNANELRDILAKKLSDNHSNIPLAKIAEYYQKNYSEQELIDVLKEQFSVTSCAKHHTEIVSLPWKRIYTTNYDNVIEKAAMNLESDIVITPITLSDDFNQDKHNICVHINGYIERLNGHTLNTEFKLTTGSYGNEYLKDKPWYDFMVNDFQSAAAILVIGYSLEFDLDILRLFSSPMMKDKVVFISSSNTEQISEKIFKNYGELYPIGVQEFPRIIEEVKKNYVPPLRKIFKSFIYKYREPIQAVKPTYEETYAMYYQGIVHDNLFSKNSFNEYNCLINRNAVKKALENYMTKRVMIAVSELGNGKSMFCKLLEEELMSMDVDVYVYSHRLNDIDSEIEDICRGKKKSIVIFDDYQGTLEILRKFHFYGCDRITFILTARTAINNVIINKLCRYLGILHENIKMLYLNSLQENELKCLVKVISENNLVASSKGESDLCEYISRSCALQFSHLLLNLFNSSDIKKRLCKVYKQLEDCHDHKLKSVAIFCLIRTTFNIDITFEEILDLFNADFSMFNTSYKNEFISEIFDCSSGEAKVKSSVIAQEILRSAINIKDIIDIILEVFLEADQHTNETFFELKRSLVSHSIFLKISINNKDEDKFPLIENFYDKIRNTKFAYRNPFFWEQFASAFLDMKKYDMAKQCLDLALEVSKDKKEFVPFQIKTIYGRYHVEKTLFELTGDKDISVDAIQAIVYANQNIIEFYNHKENNTYYVFKVAKEYPSIFNFIKCKLSVRECSIYIEQSSKILNLMSNFLRENKDIQDLKRIKGWYDNIDDSINEAKLILKSLSK